MYKLYKIYVRKFLDDNFLEDFVEFAPPPNWRTITGLAPNEI